MSQKGDESKRKTTRTEMNILKKKGMKQTKGEGGREKKKICLYKSKNGEFH